MKEYKRLTRFDKFQQLYFAKGTFQEIIDYLGELENKIENGTLIEFPCKVGDTVYLPWLYGGVCAIAYLTVTHIILDTEKSYIRTNFETDIEDYYEKYKGGQYDFNDFGKIVFTNKAEAEARLKEIQNET